MEIIGTNFFKHCPNCASINVEYVNNFKFNCLDCKFVLYHNIAAAVAIIILYKNQILFTIRNVDPDKGKLDLPGGFIDPKENAEAAACREIEEELGLLISEKNLKYITTAPNNYLYKNVLYRTMDIFYEYELHSLTEMNLEKEEIKDIVWVSKENIDLNKIGFISIKNVIKDFYLK